MSFVLILALSAIGNWPAVIPGYATRDVAEAAGREATMAHLTSEAYEEAGYGYRTELSSDERQMWAAWRDRPWTKFTVIPG